jgi:DNA-cytosine methyltransferase
MKYGSVCSGIEAASVAWHDLGWEPQWFSEIEQFPSEVLKHRFPDVPNLGDMTQLTQNPTFNERSIDLLVGGTPCQSFSVAGLRKGLADPRGNLMLTFLALADAKKPKWIVWENVPGVLSSNGGKDFGTFLGALGELGYGFAYRVLDAQHFGVAQRRRRVFVVGYLGDWRVAAAVLFERESLQGNTKPSRKKREEVTANAEGSVGTTVFAGNQQSEIAATLQTTCDDYSRADGFNVIIDRAAFNQGENAQYEPRIEAGETMSSLVAKGPHAVAQPIAFKVRGGCEGGGKGYLGQEEQAFTISATQDQQIAQPLYYESHPQDSRVNGPKDVADTVSANYGMGGGNTPLVQQPFRKVRRAQSDSDFETWEKDETANTINCFDVGDVRSTNIVAQPISIDAECNARTNQFGTLVRGGEGGTQQFVAQPIVVDWRTAQVDQGITQTLKTDLAKMSGPCIAVDTYNYTTNDRTTQTIRSQSDTEHIGAVLQPIAVDVYNQSIDGQTSATITEAVGGTNTSGPKVMHSMAIRRLIPKECERLQGFPDDWTKIPYRNKEADQCPDGPRYKACGNSMAVPVMRWIGQRIQYVENLMKEL